MSDSARDRSGGVRRQGEARTHRLPGAGRTLFDEIPLSLWVEDFSEIRKLVDALRADGVTDLARHFSERPDDLLRCASLARILDVNAATVELFGAESREDLRTTLDAVLTRDSLPDFEQTILALASGRFEHRVETVNRTIRGDEVWIELHVSIPPDSRSTWERVLVAATDQTARVRAERGLRDSEERFRTICEHAPVMIDAFDGQGRCQLWNRECERILGWSRAEVESAPDPLALFYETAEERQRVLESIRRADGKFREYRVRARDGSVRTQCWSDLVLPSGEHISVGYDITDQRRYESEMQRTQKLESLGVLAGGIAHDFNNLLVGVLGNADLALGELPAGSPSRRHLEVIESAARRAQELSQQLLAYSGRAHVTVEPLDLSRLVEETADLLEASIGRRVSVRYAIDRNGAPVQGDETQLRQVLLNLVINASDSLEGRHGEIRVSTRTERLSRRELDALALEDADPEIPYTVLEVADDGRGISPELLSRVFDPFYSSKAAGRGLGLSAALGIIRTHRGTIAVESEVDRGTTFTVLLPAGAAAPLPESSTAPSDASWRASGLALLVDDEEIVRDVGEQMLTHLGFEVRVAADGHRALEIAEDEADRLVLALLDLSMPEMSGEELSERLVAIRPDLPMLVASGYTEQETASRLASLGNVSFIQKPYRLSELQARVRKLLDPETAGN